MLSLCSACGRHVKESTCPFCGARVAVDGGARATRAARILLVATLAASAAACGFANGYGGPPPELAPNAPAGDAGAD